MFIQSFEKDTRDTCCLGGKRVRFYFETLNRTNRAGAEQRCKHRRLTLALSRLLLCSWKAAGLFSAEGRERERERIRRQREVGGNNERWIDRKTEKEVER